MYHRRGLLLRLGQGREHRHIPLARVRPVRPCSPCQKPTWCRRSGTCVPMTWTSTTLLCLNGLKSSLICTALFLGGFVPKKGFGGPCADASAPFTFGDAVDDEVPFGFGDPPYVESAEVHQPHIQMLHTDGETDFATTVKEGAFTFNLFTAAGLNGAPTGGLWPIKGAGAAGAGVGPLRLPLNGGIAWMTIGILFDPSFPAAGFAVLAALPAAAAGGFADAGGLAGAAGDPSARDAEGDTVRVAEVLIARACEDSASFVDFSLIWRCFSSSLARIGTKSSGMGLLSW